MIHSRNNAAFIDGQNLYLGIKVLGWQLDYEKFRRYLAEKYGVTKAYIFLGYQAEHAALYDQLRRFGFECIFKMIVRDSAGRVKGNVDAELVLHCVIRLLEYDRAIIVSGDGDFRCLAEYLISKRKLEKILAPNRQRCSSLLKTLGTADFVACDYLNEFEDKLGRK